MFEYNLIFSLLLILLLINSIVKNIRFEYFSLFISFFLILFLSGFRLEISSDYVEYKRIFEKIRDSGEFTEFFIEPGYLFLNKFIIYLGGSFYFLIFLIAFISILCKFYFISTFSNNKIISTLILLAFYLLLYDMGAIRRGIALGFCSVSLSYYFRNKKIKSIFFTIIASTLHSSSIIFLPFLFLNKVRLNQIGFFLIIIFSYLIQFALSKSEFGFLGQSNNIIIAKAFGYFESGTYFSEQNSFTIGFIIRILLLIFLIHKRDILILKFPYIDKLLFFYTIAIVILIIFDKLRIFSSVAIYFKIIEIVLIPIFLSIFKKFSKIFAFALVLIYLYFSYYKLINNPIEKDFYPYKSILY